MTAPPEHYVHTDDDLLARWRTFMGTGGFATTSLWTVFIGDDGRVAPVIVPIDDIPERPDAMVASLHQVFAGVLDEQHLASVAFLIARPGSDSVTVSDRAWARALLALDDPRFTRWPVHLATRDRVRVLAADDLMQAA